MGIGLFRLQRNGDHSHIIAVSGYGRYIPFDKRKRSLKKWTKTIENDYTRFKKYILLQY